jgi:S1-C subfamily serine protease
VRTALAVVAFLVATAAFGVGAWAYFQERDERRAEVDRLERQVGAMRREVAAARRDLRTARRESAQLAARLGQVSTRVNRARVNLTPLATRIRDSVFTVRTSTDEASGFVGWIEGRTTFVITAQHVVGLSVDQGEPFVRLRKRGRTWRGRVWRMDDVADLAVIRVEGRIGRPLWQRPVYRRPQPGDELLLVGSPLGYEGSVSVGFVSRVLRHEIQTDAAAHSGISGGPAVAQDGSVVGVLVSGEAENLNFAVPIGLMCRRLRNCR